MSLVHHTPGTTRRVVLDVDDARDIPALLTSLHDLGLNGHVHLEVVDEILGGAGTGIARELERRLHVHPRVETVIGDLDEDDER